MTTNNQKFDLERFARAVLFQLASLRAEMIQTQYRVIEISNHLANETKTHFQKDIEGQTAKKEKERDRVFRELLAYARLAPENFPPQAGDPQLN